MMTTELTELTEQMKKALLQTGFGVRKYQDGKYREIEGARAVVDGRSLDALYKRQLVSWHGAGGSTHQIHIELTDAGKTLFEQLLIRH